jgi:hypothetical protein
MAHCCAWQPDPAVFGPCPHCKAPAAAGRTFSKMFMRVSAEVTRTPQTRSGFTLAD